MMFRDTAKILVLLGAVQGCAGFSGEAIKGKAFDAGLACVKSAIESALADCKGDDTCRQNVKAEHAEECAAIPELCSEGQSTAVAGEDK